MSWLDRAQEQREKALRQRPMVSLVDQFNESVAARERRERIQREREALEAAQRADRERRQTALKSVHDAREAAQAADEHARQLDNAAIELERQVLGQMGLSEAEIPRFTQSPVRAKKRNLRSRKRSKKPKKPREMLSDSEVLARIEHRRLLDEAERAQIEEKRAQEARLRLIIPALNPCDDDFSWGSCYFCPDSLVEGFERPEDAEWAIASWYADDYPLLYKATAVIDRLDPETGEKIYGYKSVGASWINPEEIALGMWD